jgi:hypothetical protein
VTIEELRIALTGLPGDWTVTYEDDSGDCTVTGVDELPDLKRVHLS